MIRFKVRFSPSAPGEYPVVFKLGAPALHEDIQIRGTIHVERLKADTLSSEDQMGALITEGEQLSRKWDDDFSQVYSEDAFRRDVIAFLIKCDPVIRDALGDSRLPQAPDDADSDELLVRIREALDALYVVRDEQGRGIEW